MAEKLEKKEFKSWYLIPFVNGWSIEYCGACSGSGVIKNKYCQECEGSGKIIERSKWVNRRYVSGRKNNLF